MRFDVTALQTFPREQGQGVDFVPGRSEKFPGKSGELES